MEEAKQSSWDKLRVLQYVSEGYQNIQVVHTILSNEIVKNKVKSYDI